MSFCAKCEEDLPSNGVFVTCGECSERYHHACCGVGESTYNRMSAKRKSEWRCEFCRPGHRLTGKSSGGEARSDSSLVSSIAELKQIVTNVSKQIQDCITNQELITAKYDELIKRQGDICDKIASLDKSVAILTAAKSNGQEIMEMLHFSNKSL